MGIEPTASDALSLCIVTPSLDAYSETFIRAHLERLSSRTSVLFDGFVPKQSLDGGPLLSQRRAVRLLRAGVESMVPRARRHFTDRAVASYLRRRRVDVVLAEYGPTGVAVMDACAAAGVPLVVHFHGFDAYRADTIAGHTPAYARLFSRAAAVVAVSNDMARRLAALGAIGDRLHTNPCGVDLSRFAGAHPADAPPMFLATGRFVSKKAPHLTVRAFARLVETCPRARLIMAGDGPLLDMCRQLAQTLHIGHAVSFPGVQSQEQVAVLMRQARAFVQHSVTADDGDSEGTPVAVLEAGASGLPVVSTRHGGIVDAVVSDETGILVEEGDVDAMAQAMARLATDPALAGRMGAFARTHIERHFGMDGSIGRLRAILRDASAARL